MSTAKTALPPPSQANGFETSIYQPTPDGDGRPHSMIADPQTVHDNRIASPDGSRGPRFHEEWDASQRGSSIAESSGVNPHRPVSYVAPQGSGVTGDGAVSLSRGNTLRKKASVRRSLSLKRSGSRRSMKAGSVRSLALQATTDQDEMHSAFYCPVPTSANPTEVLANRFQAWRKILKDLIAYFREIQTHYEHRAKSLLRLANVLNNTTTPPGFIASGGLDDALQILRAYNKQAIAEANKAREIEEDVILALTGLRSDLAQKIKEIKNLAGDFKNSVEKEMDNTRRAVNLLQEALGQAELDPSLTVGKQDPYLLRLAVDRQLERQIDEENYLHQAYLNLESSGMELESIVVGEIQKAYNAYAGILKRESDAAYNAIEELRTGPISMPKNREWTAFIQRDDRFVDPNLPMRSAESIHYPGRDHYACQELRAGLLERKSKYLKSYTPGWYVLSPTHLHEFKSADKTQAPMMSLYLPEQKLGSHSTEGSSSNKFILKGRQVGTMHRGHKWVFRAESYDTMMAWYEDIKRLTEQTPEERTNLVRASSRSVSRTSQRSSLSSDGVDVNDDEEDPPFSGGIPPSASQQQQQQQQQPQQQQRQDGVPPRRPSGGRFPSDLQVNVQRGAQVPVSPLSPTSSVGYESYFPPDPFTPSAGGGNAGGGSVERPRERAASPAASGSDHLAQYPLLAAAARGMLGQVDPALAAKVNAQQQQQQQQQQKQDGVERSFAAPNANTTWAEPVPIHLPQKIPSHGQGSVSSARSSTVDGIGQDGHERQAQLGGVVGTNGTNGAGGEGLGRPGAGSRMESEISTVSPHLHVPGEYPRGSIGGL